MGKKMTESYLGVTYGLGDIPKAGKNYFFSKL
jgi:hypothetical protein